MKKWHMIIDVEKCEDCNNCFLACKDEHIDNEWSGYALPQPRHEQRWIDILRKERGKFPLIDVNFLPKTCMHCDNAPCIKASNGSIDKRRDGIVFIDPYRAKGQKDLTKACPYGMIWWNEEQDVPQKCTFCAHLLDEGWKKPRCVQACPTGALRVEYVDDGEMAKLVEIEKLETLNPQYNTQPSVYYKNLHLFTTCFIGGSIAAESGGKTECVKDAKIVLFRERQKIGETASDCFGDFRFDGLAENSGTYRIDILLGNCLKKTLEVDLHEDSLNLGVILV